jgi:hypothetical protein
VDKTWRIIVGGHDEKLGKTYEKIEVISFSILL